MDSSTPKTVVLGVTGSIAAYKAAVLTRLLVKGGFDVHVIMTEAATRFVAPLTFRTLSRNPVGSDLFAAPEMWIPGHIALAERASVVVVAPCTANVLAKIAHGMADDLLCGTVLATQAPLVVAPAMNSGMWANAATQANIETLNQRGVHLVDSGTGDLACGTSGKGRMAEPEAVFEAVEQTLALSRNRGL